MRKILIIIAMVLVAVGAVVSDRVWGIKFIDKWLPKNNTQGSMLSTQKVTNEESMVIDVVKKASPSVVTVSVKKTVMPLRQQMFNFGPFGMFNIPNQSPSTQNQEEDIGSGFIISADGLIVTNKHVVSDTSAKYKIVLKDDRTFEVQKIYRDPANDLAILKIEATGLTPVEMGDSSKLEVGQYAIAIGTALGEFRSTVTTGVVSGLGRGIAAGGPFEGAVEQLDGVIQTDAAINPGNSGGPLLNSAGQVIGVNTAVSSQGQNIGFAIPINVIKDAIDNFNKTGQFSRPYLGVRYQMVGLKLALANDVPQGAYVQEIVADSPADKAKIQADDIITKIGGVKVDGNDAAGLTKLIGGHKVGDQVQIELWRDGETKTVTVTLEEAK
jgi:serine protease Do